VADFDVHAVSGLTVANWDDPEGLDAAPSRLQTRPGFPLKRFRTVVGTLVRLEAVVGASQGPADGALGGRLFSADLVEGQPVNWLLPIAGFSSVVRFRPLWVGHHTVAVRRAGGGSLLIPMDVEAV
jgi:hypothetical protein